MKPSNPLKLLSTLLLVSVPALGFVLALGLLPIDRFTSRTWEALLIGSPINSPFIPLQSLTKTEKGDLAFQSNEPIFQSVHFTTDEYGYRNTPPACTDPQAVIIGDSMAVGGSLSQSETPSAKLSEALRTCVRSFAGGSYSYALHSIFGLGLRPKYVILILTQRTAGGIPSLSNPNLSGWGVHQLPGIQSLHRNYLEFRKNLYWNFRARHGVVESIKRLWSSPDLEATSPRVSSDDTKKPILFYSGDWERRVSDLEMQSDLQHLERLSQDLKPLGAKLIFTFVPNKSTIYPGSFVDRDSDFIDRFLPLTQGRDFEFIDLFHPFREDWKKGIMNHHLQDTHWNERGVSHFVEKAIDLMNRSKGKSL